MGKSKGQKDKIGSRQKTELKMRGMKREREKNVGESSFFTAST